MVVFKVIETMTKSYFFIKEIKEVISFRETVLANRSNTIGYSAKADSHMLSESRILFS